MQISRISLVVAVALVSVVPSGAAMRSRRGPTAQHTQKKASSKPVARRTSFKPGQRGIDDTRATEIQQALIKAGYLSGNPTGHWDSNTESAMQKLQGDNGWQTKLVPDSRALIKLGLGPKMDSTAMTADNTIETTGTK